MPRNLSVEGAGELRDLSRQLRGLEARKEILKRLRKELREGAKPMVPAVRRRVLALPSKGESARRGRPGLRRSIARATKLSVSTSGKKAGVSVRVDPGKMPSGQKALPAYLEGQVSPWRHPLFGDRDHWHAQASHPFFEPAVRPLLPTAMEAAERALDSVAEEIERG